MTLTQTLHWLNTHWLQIVAVVLALFAVGTAAHKAAVSLRAAGYTKLAGWAETVSVVALNAYAIARALAAAFGRPIDPKPEPATVSKGNPGFATARTMSFIFIGGILALPFVLAIFGPTGCSATQVHTQAVTADAVARAFNRAEPLVIAEYERTGRESITSACCDRARMVEALRVHDARWQPVVGSWEIARLAHDTWRVELMACQGPSPAPSCTQSVAHLGAVFLVSLNQARCALHAIGRADLDPLRDALACDPPDGGAS